MNSRAKDYSKKCPQGAYKHWCSLSTGKYLLGWGLMLALSCALADSQNSHMQCTTVDHGVVECIGPLLDEPVAQPDSVEVDIPAEPSAPAQPSAQDTSIADAVEPVVDAPSTTRSINQWRRCASSPATVSSINLAKIEQQRRAATIDVTADSVELQSDQIYTLNGSVVFHRADQHLEADHLVYDKQQGSLAAQGGVQYVESSVSLSSEHIHIDMNTDEALLEQVEFYLPASHARGSAQAISLRGPGIQDMTRTTYTTCDVSQPDWELSARKVTLLQEQGIGSARSVKMRFKGVPILYTPFLSFPLDDRRKSGFLAPTIGGSEESGADIRLPYYWNIAPNYDATITPRILEQRGTQLGGELRYLNRKHHGTAVIEYLPSDNKFDDDRSLVSLEHRGHITPRLKTVVLFKDVSDKQYFEDLGDSLNLASITHLDRRFDSEYRGNNWRVKARIQDFQTIDSSIAPGDRPYERLPQIKLHAISPWKPLGIDARINTEYVYFDHDVNVTGHRLDIKPELSFNIQKPGYFVKPKVALRHTRYDLDEPLTAGDTKTPDRTTPIYSLDSGLFLERQSSWFKQPFIQTLEPRAYYLYVPQRAQSDLPVFDTGELDFQYHQMFKDNRFSGADRMGDANQLTLALSTRMIDPGTGRQYLRASIGEIFYFRNLEVALPGEAEATNGQSDIIGDVELQLSRRWELSSGVHWNPNDARAERVHFRAQYQAGPRHIVNVSYRYRRDILDQIDASILWQVSPSWNVVGRWYYALDDDITLESFGGIEYDSCCWALRLVGRNYVNSNDGKHNRSLYAQIEFKGLGAIGKPVEELLERGILGYRRNP